MSAVTGRRAWKPPRKLGKSFSRSGSAKPPEMRKGIRDRVIKYSRVDGTRHENIGRMSLLRQRLYLTLRFGLKCGVFSEYEDTERYRNEACIMMLLLRSLLDSRKATSRKHIYSEQCLRTHVLTYAMHVTSIG